MLPLVAPHRELQPFLDAVDEVMVELCAGVWNAAEIGLAEVESARMHTEALRRAGFEIIHDGAAGVPTAFVAEWRQGRGGPTVGYLPEYDALPGLGNVAEPREAPLVDGKTSGHACGHNLLGAGCTAAAIATKRWAEHTGSACTLRVYGCAAEETEGAKVYMARAGLFGDVDACLAWHPAPVAAAGLVRTSALNDIKVEFFGRSAHAGVSPWEGRSALHAIELFAHGLNLMREHIMSTSRIHYVYESAGHAANIIPDYSRMWLRLRDVDRVSLDALTDWARAVAEGAAMATQTTSSFRVYYGCWDLLPNAPLAQRVYDHLTAVGVPEWTDAEQDFAREAQREFNVEPAGMATTVLPFIPDLTAGGSTDVGDVSWVTPTVAFVVPTMPLGIGPHTWPATACHGMSIGQRAARAATAVMAATAVDLITDQTFLADVRADFTERRGERRYDCAIPAEQAAPIGLPAFLVKGALDEGLTLTQSSPAT